MCDFSKLVRRKNYRVLRNAGYPVSFCKRARDFNPTRIKYYSTRPYIDTIKSLEDN